jgi:hypothetical protein
MDDRTVNNVPALTSLARVFARLGSIVIRKPERLAQMRPLAYVVLVGGMCAGKSYLAHAAVTRPELAGRYAVAPRCVTREPRQGDEADGAVSVTWKQFRDRVDAANFLMSWERPLPDGTLIGYGCLRPPGSGIPILMAGHGIYTNKRSVRPVDALDNALVVGVEAPLVVRERRLQRRSTDLVSRGRAYVEARLAHDDKEMDSNVDILVRNYGPTESRSATDFAAVLGHVLSTKGDQSA